MSVKRSGLERECEQLCAQMGLILHDVAMEREPAGSYLRIYVDKDGGVQLDDCEAFHRAIMPKCEHLEYDFLEVCSPGIDRPIKTERDAQRCIGMRVAVKLFKPFDGQKVFIGALESMTKDEIVLTVSGERVAFPKRSVALLKLEPDLDGELEQASTLEGGQDQ